MEMAENLFRTGLTGATLVMTVVLAPLGIAAAACGDERRARGDVNSHKIDYKYALDDGGYLTVPPVNCRRGH